MTEWACVLNGDEQCDVESWARVANAWVGSRNVDGRVRRVLAIDVVRCNPTRSAFTGRCDILAVSTWLQLTCSTVGTAWAMRLASHQHDTTGRACMCREAVHVQTLPAHNCVCARAPLPPACHSAQNTSPVSRHSWALHVVESAPGSTWPSDNWAQRPADNPWQPLYDESS
jgi:hypothetical protein